VVSAIGYAPPGSARRAEGGGAPFAEFGGPAVQRLCLVMLATVPEQES